MRHLVAVGSTSNQALEMGERICFVAGGSPRGDNHLPRDDVQVEKPGQGAMANVLEFTPQHMSSRHGQIGMQSLQGLHPCQFIHTDRSFSLFGYLGGSRIERAALTDFLLALFIRHLR